ncbi:MAG: recombinase RecJ [Candidatus Altiarchaeales archaeon]|nr:recombinase RecJ [Candidatus Altiarchaeales archaeon]
MSFESFNRRAKEIGGKLSAENEVLVVSHHDADGITSCAVMVDLLRSIDVETDYMCIKQLDSTTISRIREYRGRPTVFCDMGSGQLPLIEENKIPDFYVFDHHPPAFEHPNQLNPHSFGYDGGSEISGAGVAYLFAKALGRPDMAHLAVVGAVGDMQDNSGALKSLNRMPLEDAVSAKNLLVENDIRMFGRQSRSLSQMLAYSSEPYLPMLTGDQLACSQFLEGLGLPLKDDLGEYSSYVDLNRAQRRKLTSAIYMRLLDFGTPEYIIQSMIGEVYTLLCETPKTELADSKEYATVLNACGRQQQSELGVKVCLGDRGETWDRARTLLESHRRNLREGLEYLKGNGTHSLSHIYYFDAGEVIPEAIIGVVAGMAYGARIIPPDKPVFAFAQDQDDDSKLKVSGRANMRLIRGGVHLGEALKHVSSELEGEGGGHDIAAGAKIPRKNKTKLLEKINQKIKKQQQTNN